MRVIFCAEPFVPGRVDPAYLAESAAAERVRFDLDLLNYEALVHEGDLSRALRRVAEHRIPVEAIYRGWMLTVAQYRAFYEALVAGGVRLVNDPDAYRHCHYLPESYPVIRDMTAETVWMPTEGIVPIEQVLELLRPFGDRAAIVKDYVKSRKHEWDEACFIPSAADRQAVEQVVRRFLELQGEDLAEGLVFHEYIAYEPLGAHGKSGMPLSREFRLWVLDGKIVYWSESWEEGDYGGLEPPLEQFRTVAQQVQSRFFTMDVAPTLAGEWQIIELGDGQVAGLPETADPIEFYRALREHWPS